MTSDLHAIARERFSRPIGGRYELLDTPILGSGGQGTVFAAMDVQPEAPRSPYVAVKVYRGGETPGAATGASPDTSSPEPRPASSPAFDKTRPIANTRDIPDGGGKILTVGNEQVVIGRPVTYVANHPYVPTLVFSATCTHSGCTVGGIVGGTITCPCHGSKFGLDGSVKQGPATMPLRRLDARTDDNGDVYLQ